MSALDRINELLLDAAREALEDELEEIDIEGQVEKEIENQIDNLDLEDQAKDAVKSAIEDYDIEDAVDRAIDSRMTTANLEQLIKAAVTDFGYADYIYKRVNEQLNTNPQLLNLIVQRLLQSDEFMAAVVKHVQLNSSTSNWFYRQWCRIRKWR